ncbi:MAG: (d)CMP kinase [Chlorobiota bacterium]|nr:(d)CMP kinase [Chlorobiota bacterium]QQS67814.1 MAG: (d)CMP kinase [Chlorobiota bacterium]
MRDKIVIAIDGPAASGKSTTAKLVAKKLNLNYIDTGAMYRAITLAVLQAGVSPSNKDDVEFIAMNVNIKIEHDKEFLLKVMLNEIDVSKEIRKNDISNNVSVVCMYPLVRKRMVELQREMGKKGGVVLDGRDIGTVVYPNADVKIYMIANIESRAKRRFLELEKSGEIIDLKDLIKDILERDRIDSTRDESPLKKADDAIELDTSNMSITEQVNSVLKIIETKTNVL